LSLNVESAVAEADVEPVAVVDAVDTVAAEELETATKVSARIAKLTIVLQMHAENTNALRGEETTMNAFASSAGSKATSRSIVSPTNP
jgi:hypothetical protein